MGEIGLKEGRRGDLDKEAIAFADEPSSSLGKTHRAAYIAPPILGVERLAFDPFTGDCRHQPRVRVARRQANQAREQVVAYRIHLPRMEGKIQIEGPKPQPPPIRL